MGQQANPSVHYSVLSKELEWEKIGIRRTFGIRGMDSGGSEVFCLEDVTVSGNFAEEIAKLLNTYQASAIQAKDIIEDLVAEYDPELPE